MSKYSKNQLSDAIASSKTIKEALTALGIRGTTDAYKNFKLNCKEWNISTSHFLTQSEIGMRNWESSKFKKTPIEALLVENSKASRTNLKRRLYKEGLKKPICEMAGCGQDENWLGQKISLILDHINGVWNDNRLENLRIVCPMCNAALPTHSGKNMKKKVNKNNFENKKSKERPDKRIVQRPSKEDLKILVWEIPTVQIARKYGVSDKAVEKWTKSYEIEKPPRGYWAKQYSKKTK
jgi:hypothetical protein